MLPVKKQKQQESREKINPKAIRKSYMNRIEEDLLSEGVVLFEPKVNLNIDSEHLVLPREVTEVTSRELGEYLSAYTQQKAYLRTLYGRCELALEEAKRAYLYSTEPYYKRYTNDKMSETAKDRLINAIPEVKPLYEEYVDYQRKKSIVEMSIANVEDIIFMLSREVTRRTGDFRDDSREYNVRRH